MPHAHATCPIVIVGGGFGGLALAIRLKAAGIHDFTILEKADALGGVWRDNVYPGAACDVPSRFYSFSFEQDWPWSSRFGGQGEILAYLNHCARKYDVLDHVRFNCQADSARFDANAGRWIIETADGERLEARALVSAIGLFNQPIYPDIAGRELFGGEAFHSAEWNHDCDLTGKRVAVIGTGASAIQFVPEVAKIAGKLFVCQRSPQYVQPKDMGPPPERRNWMHDTPLWRRIERQRIYNSFEDGAGRRYSAASAEQGRQAFLRYLADQAPEPELRRKLTPDYPFGCKRMLQSNDYYPALRRPNVEVVDLPVVEILDHAIRLGDGTVHPVDVIIYGTGFRPTDYLPSLDVEGLDGLRLREAWKDGAEAYLGVTVAGCPNFFMIYGPNTNAAASIIYMIEHQAEYIAQCVEALRERPRAFMQVRPDVQARFNAKAHARLAESVVASDDCLSYFKLPSGKIVTQWPWSMAEYHRRTSAVDLADFAFCEAGGDPVSSSPPRTAA